MWGKGGFGWQDCIAGFRTKIGDKGKEGGRQKNSLRKKKQQTKMREEEIGRRGNGQRGKWVWARDMGGTGKGHQDEKYKYCGKNLKKGGRL